MSQLTEGEVKKIAKLACLPLTEEEIKKLRVQLSDILKYISLLDELSTEKNLTTAFTGNVNTFREDKVLTAEVLPPDKVLKNAQRVFGRYFVVPSVFGEMPTNK